MQFTEEDMQDRYHRIEEAIKDPEGEVKSTDMLFAIWMLGVKVNEIEQQLGRIVGKNNLKRVMQ